MVNNGSASIEPTYWLSGIPTTQTEPGEVMVELLDGEGRVLISHEADLYEVEDEEASERSLSVLIPLPDKALSSVRIVKDGTAVAERHLRSITGHSSGVLVTTSDPGIISLAWGSRDVPALVRYTPDDGQSWTTLGVDILGGQLQVDPVQLPGGQGHFEVRLADTQFPIVLKTSVPVTLPDAPPSVRIVGPTSLVWGQPLLLIGEAMDREDGPITVLRWSVDGKGVAAGQTLQVTGLTPGEHVIALIVQDRMGHVARAEHYIVVVD